MSAISLTSLLLLSLSMGSPEAAAEQQAVDRGCDIELQARVSGTGSQHVILIGGVSASPNEWQRTLGSLQSKYTVHVVSVPGLGGIPIAGEHCDADIQSVADALGRYLERNATPGKAIVVGHSAGGVATLQLAATRGDLISGIVVVDALPFTAANFGVDKVDEAWQDRIHSEYRQMLAESQTKFAERLRSQLQTSVQDISIAQRIANVAAGSNRRIYSSLYSSTMMTDLRGLKLQHVPVFVIYASQSSNGAPAGFMRKRYLQQYTWLADERLLEVENARHYVMLDQPEVFTERLQHAIESIIATYSR